MKNLIRTIAKEEAEYVLKSSYRYLENSIEHNAQHCLKLKQRLDKLVEHLGLDEKTGEPIIFEDKS